MIAGLSSLWCQHLPEAWVCHVSEEAAESRIQAVAELPATLPPASFRPAAFRLHPSGAPLDSHSQHIGKQSKLTYEEAQTSLHGPPKVVLLGLSRGRLCIRK